MLLRCHCAGIAFAIVLGFAGMVRADERAVVVVMESGQNVPTPELLADLSVHLAGSARVEGGPSLNGATADRFKSRVLFARRQLLSRVRKDPELRELCAPREDR